MSQIEDDPWNPQPTGHSSSNNVQKEDRNTSAPVDDGWDTGNSTANQSSNDAPKTTAPADDPWGAGSSTTNQSNNEAPKTNAPADDPWGAGSSTDNNYSNDARQKPAPAGGSWGTGDSSTNNYRNDTRRKFPQSGGSWGGANRPNNNNFRNDTRRRPAPANDSWSGGNSSANETQNVAAAGTAPADDPWGGGSNSTNNAPVNSNWNTNQSHNDTTAKTASSNDLWTDGGQADETNTNNNTTVDGAERPAPYKPEQMNLDEEAELQATDAGENFQRYKDQKVTCVPMNLVKPIEKFEDVIQSKLLLGNLKTLKYSEMTPIQKWAMPAIMAGYDIIGCAQTGSGKTAAFLLPVLQTILKTELEPHDPNADCQHPFCLIVSPTRELAKQIYTHAQLLSKDSIIKCRVVYGQISTHYLKAQMSDGCHVLVATLGRLKDFLERGWIDFANIKYVILDEGDRLVDERSTSDIRAIFDHPTMPPKEKRQTLFFSATFKEGIQHNAKEYLKDNFMFLAVGRVGAANEDIKQEFLQVSRKDKKRELRQILQQVPHEEKTIVFTQTKHIADILAAFFTQLKLESTSIHGDRHQSQREEAISLFKRGIKRFLISSPVGNRGLDLPKVGLVINYDLPENIDEYVHRIGRTGRAGHTGKAISFYDPERDREILPDLLRILKDAKQEIPDWLKDESNSSFSADCSMSEKRPADDDAGNPPKKLDSGEQASEPSGVEAQPFVEEW